MAHAFIPYGIYWSTPFARWQGAIAHLNSLKLVQNAVSWATEDSDLLSIRARGSFARVLNPLTAQEESGWEIANMLVALFMLVAIGVVWTLWRRRERPMALQLPEAKTAQGHEEVGR